MISTYKVLGQVSPIASTLTTLYEVPTSASTVCSTLVIANRGVPGFVRVAVRPAGENIDNKHYIVYDIPVNQYESIFLTIGVTITSTDIISVFSSTSDMSFNLFGTEML